MTSTPPDERDDARDPRGRMPAVHDGWSAGVSVFSAVPGINLLLAPDSPRFTVLAASDGFLGKTKRRPDDVVGRPLFELLGSLNPTFRGTLAPLRLRQSLQRVIANRGSDDMRVVRYDLADGQGGSSVHYWHPCNAPVLDRNGAVQLLVHHLEDVTRLVLTDEAAAAAERRAQLSLWASELRYRTLFDSIDEGFCIIDVKLDATGRATDYCFVEANPAFEQQTGITNAVGQCMKTLIPSQEEHWFEIYGRVARTGEPIRFEAPAAALHRVFDVYAFRIGLPDDHRLAVLFSDVTADRQVETEREQLLAERQRLLATAQAERDAATAARAEAEAASRAKSEFLAVMSHELRTPLNAIGGYTELIELGIHGPVTQAQQIALARIQQSQRHLLGLIEGVLDYSRVEAGVARYRLEVVPVVEAVAEAEALVAPQMRNKGLGYSWSGAPPDLAVRADREKLQQILLNLLSNAVKFTHPRGDAPGSIHVSCTVTGSPADGRVAIHVRDTGEGIPADKLDRVFEPFVQVDQRLTRPQDGVGLGLAISRDLAHGMDGGLTAESRPGDGSRFTLTLPRA